MMKKICKHLIPLLLVLLMLPVTAFAAGTVNTEAKTSLTITANYDGKLPVRTMQFRVYRVASMASNGDLTVIEPFRKFEKELDIHGKNDSAWNTMAAKLEREIILDPTIQPLATAAANDSGLAEFTDLPVGLYLILSDGVELDQYVYSTAPFFVMLPMQDMEANEWVYAVTANAKIAQTPAKTDYTVVKVWKDDCHKEKRPKSITISLMRDGKRYDTITLPHDGHWSYTWHDLEKIYKWTVVEARLDGYAKPDVTHEGNTFVVTNTCDKSTPTKPTLPQTGQLWWPVPILFLAGLMFVVVGLIRRRRADDEA